MSAIAGIIHLDGRPVQQGLVERMTACMSYRGPDGIHHWHKAGVAMGHGLHRTTVASAHEVQPLFNEQSQRAIVMDGRMDNRTELLAALAKAGRKPVNLSDSALVLCAFEEWGDRCVEEFDGDFAFAIWDERSRELFCARDRIGTKSFHYALVGDTLLFASDVRAIWYSPLFKPVFNDGLALEHLAGEWLHHDQTFWQDLHRLMPAHYMRVNMAGLQKVCYWQPDPFARLPCKTEQDHEAYHRWLLGDIVQTLSASDRPLAFEVSGGLDSSALYAVACDLEGKGRLQSPGIKGYTFDFAGVENADESEYVKAMESHCGRSIQTVEPLLPSVQWYAQFARDFKTFAGYPNSVMGMGLYRQAVADGCQVVISGCGGDEWLGGWDLGYAEALLSRDWAGLWACWREDTEEQGIAAAAWRLLRKGLLTQMPEMLKKPLRYAMGRQHYVGFSKTAWLTEQSGATFAQRRQRYALPHLAKYARLTQQYQHAALHEPWVQLIQEMEDINCALAGVEWRRPLAHPRMIQFAFSLPERFRSSARFDRALHRKALKGLMPEAVLQRRIKADFSGTYLPFMLDEIMKSEHKAEAQWLRPDGLAWMRKLAAEDDDSGRTLYGGWPHMQMWAYWGLMSLGRSPEVR